MHRQLVSLDQVIQCPKCNDMQRWGASFNPMRTPQNARAPNAESKLPPRFAQPRLPNPQTDSSLFSEEASMTIFDLSCPTEESEDPAMPSLKSTPGNSRTMLFVVRRIIQNQTHWVLKDSGSVRNLMTMYSSA